MEYLLLIHEDEKQMQGVTPEQNGGRLAAYGAYMKAMADAGVIKGGQRLHPSSTATTVRVKNGKTSVLNGPYAEIKEQLGGYFLIDAPDLDAAISLGRPLPGGRVWRDGGAADLADVGPRKVMTGPDAHERDRETGGVLPRISVDDRSLAALTTALATIVGLWLLVYVVGAIAPLAGPHMGERAGQASTLASRTP